MKNLMDRILLSLVLASAMTRHERKRLFAQTGSVFWIAVTSN